MTDERRLLAADFDYACPSELIAQHPAERRDESRLLALHRATGALSHRHFRDLPALLAPGDLLVLNATRVLPARLIGTRENGAPAEVLLVRPEPDGTWLAMAHPGGKLKAGRTVTFGADSAAEIVSVAGGGLRVVRFTGALDAVATMQRYGAVPLPPYINRSPDPTDRERYQTVFARVDGSVAAPTAGLHFTSELLAHIRSTGIETAEVLLHVGPGTFKPVDADDPAKHRMHAEWYEVPETTALAIHAAKARGARVWAVGTTVARTLETAGAGGALRAGSGWTDLFIYPPYRFRVVDALITNFHLPRSTLLMLVAAFAGYEATMAAYRAAVAARYRLYSYGDAMAIL